ncbi:zinc transporter ZupT [Corynebacterium liangguodongii]|uniref:Zinc transporter ZupT n=1 Tax=Corynebacterium liangguodongii TaxID=2079535 RepID=A0A2S0WFV5_9CORY|nr:zinc transporter ZupT [Corynebacterium liangguodongii]AWB84651.1 zinc transporter ZupT [Corynebacterium liangguodongii]PWB99659.1 zinc transporter ZupT [Corynebacterium liangguodongii]
MTPGVPIEADSVTIAFAITLFAGISTGIGGLLVALKSNPTNRFLAGSLGFSTGVMVYISLVELLPSGIDGLGEVVGAAGPVYGVAAFFAGVVLIAVIDRLVPEPINPHEVPSAGTADRARSVMMRAGALTGVAIAVHNFPEGFATFISALGDPKVALPIAVAIAIHNIPEGVAVAVPLREATGKKWAAAGWATASGLAEPLGAAAGFLLLMPFMGPATLGLSFAAVAGIMVFISFDKLLPSAVATGQHHFYVYGVMGGMAVMAASLIVLN